MSSSKLPVTEIGIGMTLGLLWGYGRRFLESKGIVSGTLNPRPEAFDIDPCLHELFIELSTLPDLDKEAFGKSIEEADRILFLEKQLREKKIYPLLGDTTRVYTIRNRLCLEFQVLLTKCTDARQLSIMKRIIHDILDRINQHYNCIYTLCERIRAEDAFLGN